MSKKVFFTMDVDFVKGSESGVLNLIDFCNRLSLKADFFITGKFAPEYPEIVQEIAKSGFGIGSHGWDHGETPTENFGDSSYNDQKERIVLATQAIEKASGVRPQMFRAPNLWINETTIQVLEEEGYRLDSSVPARRMMGRIRKFNYFKAPLAPYYPSPVDLGKKGDCKILEVPPAAFFVPINLSALRMLKVRGLKPFIALLAKSTSNLVFYGHPAEFVPVEKLQYPYPVPSRHLKGIGPENFQLAEEFLSYLFSKGYEPGVMSEIKI